MKSTKSFLLAAAGLVLCLANSAAAALVAPVLKSPPNGSANVPPKSVTLDWAAAKGAGGYDYVVKDAKGNVIKEGSLAGSKTQVRVNLDYLQTYKWQVRSTHSASKPSAWSSRWSFTTADHARPELVAPLDGASGIGSVEADGTTHVTLNWTTLNGSNQYELQLANNASFSAATTRVVNGTGTDVVLENPSIVFWRLRSLVAADKPYWSATRSFTPVSPRATPEIASPKVGDVLGGGSIPMTWLGVGGVRSYTWTLWEGRTAGGKINKSRTVLALADTYQWSEIQYCPPIGYLTLGVSAGGRASNPSTFVFKSVAPQLRQGGWGAYKRFYMSWSRVGGNQGYMVTITAKDGHSNVYTTGRNDETLSLPATVLSADGFTYTVKAVGFDGISSDPSVTLPEGPRQF